MRKCPNGHDVSDDVKFCPKCGAEIQKNVAEDARFCKKCGQERKRTEKFCSHCGTPFFGNQTSLDLGEVAHGSSLNKKLVFFLVLVPIILIGGYFINDHFQEKKRIEKEQIEENKRAVEEERKRIEEENKPANLFYKTISQNNDVWKTKPAIDRGDEVSRVWCLFFYPMNKNCGQVSIVKFHPDFSAYSKAYSCKVPYTIQDNYIIFTARFLPGHYGPPYESYEFVEFMLEIQSTGNNVRLVRSKDGRTQVFDVSSHNVKDPIKQ